MPRALRHPARRALLRTADGVTIEAFYEPGTAPAPSAATFGHPADAVDGCLAATVEHAGGQAIHGAPTTVPPSAGSEWERVAGVAGTGARATSVIVVAHGFTGDLGRPHVRRIARAFARHAAVVTFSFRGHGRSGGHSTVGDREVLDLAAAVGWARQFGHQRVITVGFSMGGSVVLRHAALQGGANGHQSAGSHARTEALLEPLTATGMADTAGMAGTTPAPRAGDNPVATGGKTLTRADAHTVAAAVAARPEARTDAVVAVSAPARWYYRGTAPMRRLHWLVTRPEGRVVGRYGFGTRIHSRDWDPVPLSPVESVPLIAPTPLLIVHGDRDPYFPLDHPRMLAAASGGAADLWVEPGMGHAEHAADGALLERIAHWAGTHAG